MPHKTNAAGGQPAARFLDAGQASISAAYSTTSATRNFLCDLFSFAWWGCPC